MPLTYHPEFYAVIEPMIPVMAATPKAPVHDVETRRSRLKATLGPLLNAMPDDPDVTRTQHTTKSYDGHSVVITQYSKGNTPLDTPDPAILHIHGGGYIAGDVPMFDKILAERTSSSNVPFFSIEYRLAPEHPFPAALEDCYAALLYLQSSAKALNIDPTRIAIMGESAGGGLAAALAMTARDRNFSPPIKKQILIYPMLDHLNTTPNPSLEPYAFWKMEDSVTGWSAYLGTDISGGKTYTPPSPSSYPLSWASPAQVESVNDLPPTYIDVGTLDNFRDEAMRYATRLMEANVDVEFHLYHGVPHAFEVLAPQSGPAKMAVANRLAAIKSV